MKFEYDVIVVGGGHAGCEAAVASANLGAETLLISSDLGRVAQMSCNPAVGGIAKGQIVREIDALGGQMGIIADQTAIQFRMLNRSKGPAVWSPRVQSDRTRFMDEWRKVLDLTRGLSLFQDTVTSFLFSETEGKKSVEGLKTALGFRFKAKKIILTAGTFLNGLLHFGELQIEGGRIAENSSLGLTEQLIETGFSAMRMKTGTPARIDGRSIDFSKTQRQDGDDEVVLNMIQESDETEGKVSLLYRDFHKFSFLPEVQRTLSPRSCFIVHTNPQSHKVLHDNLDRSPLYNGQIKSIGPRYCPSIETKIVTFADKESHQLFLEPEGETINEFYINGFSSSLPWEVQLESLQNIEALRNVHFLRPGYAIEYDCFDPRQLTHDLQTKLVDGLYFAGQVNGTTGYEEAAAQGLMAGINAARAVKGQAPVVLKRDEAYIGVLIDDLVTKGVDEPYRMFTSRAEYRILLRQDDADMRLTPVGHEIGLVTEHRYQAMLSKKTQRDSLIKWCSEFKVYGNKALDEYLEKTGSSPLKTGLRLVELIKRPQLSIIILSDFIPELREFLDTLEKVRKDEIIESAEILIKYEGYIKREQELADKTLRLEYVKLPEGMDYESLTALSTEARQKLTLIRPSTIGQASRIPGVSPADINILLIMLKR